ncbi:hypothetical protein DVH05_017985 [Phytophthora capsici]|nr:hypothetical protein DVH05_017985 [Phytophthora capsici]
MSPRLTSAELKRFRRSLKDVLDREESGTPTSEARAIKEQFWAELRSLLGGNPQS